MKSYYSFDEFHDSKCRMLAFPSIVTHFVSQFTTKNIYQKQNSITCWKKSLADVFTTFKMLNKNLKARVVWEKRDLRGFFYLKKGCCFFLIFLFHEKCGIFFSLISDCKHNFTTPYNFREKIAVTCSDTKTQKNHLVCNVNYTLSTVPYS
jgi:hypothetical protein